MASLRHEEAIAEALTLVRRYERNRRQYEAIDAINVRQDWLKQFDEFCMRLNSYKARLGLLQEANSVGRAAGLTALLSRLPTPLRTAGDITRIHAAVRALEQFLFHVGVGECPNETVAENTVAALTTQPAVDPMMTVDEAAELLGINRNTLYDAIKRDEIPGARRIGRTIRIHRATFMKWLQSA